MKMGDSKSNMIFNLVLTFFILLSILFFDRPLSIFINDNLKVTQHVFNSFTNFFDSVFFYSIWILLFFIILGVFLIFKNGNKRLGLIFLTIVFTNLASYGLITPKIKTELKRARPSLYLIGGEQTTDFFNKQSKDYSYPSSHAAFYLSLFLPLAFFYKRFALLILFIPGVISVGRVVQNHHYLSDVLTSLLIVFNVQLFIFSLLFWLYQGWINFKIKIINRNE